MLAIARIAEQGIYGAAGVCAAFMLFAILVFEQVMAMGLLLTPIALIISAAVLVFVILRHGESAALKMLIPAAVIVVVITVVMQIFSIRVPIFMFVAWLGGGLLAVVLRRTVRLDYTVLAAIPIACFVAVVSGFFHERLTLFWKTLLLQSIAPMSQAQTDQVALDKITQLLESMAPLLSQSAGNWAIIVLLCSVFLARSWQAKLFNPGGFQKEFHALKLGRNAVWLCLLVVVISMLVNGYFWPAIASVFMFVFFIQGLSVLHCVVKQRAISQGWLIGLYILMPLPQTVLLVGALGLADNLLRLRQT